MYKNNNIHNTITLFRMRNECVKRLWLCNDNNIVLIIMMIITLLFVV